LRFDQVSKNSADEKRVPLLQEHAAVSDDHPAVLQGEVKGNL
jgi:hypothetical protein